MAESAGVDTRGPSSTCGGGRGRRTVVGSGVPLGVGGDDPLDASPGRPGAVVAATSGDRTSGATGRRAPRVRNAFEGEPVRAAVSDDPAVRESTRLVLAAGVLAGLCYAASMVVLKPAQIGIASDVYYHAARALLAGENVYGVTPPDHPGYRYLYPPVVVLAFLPHALLGSEAAALALQTLLTVAAGVGTAVVSWRTLARRGVALTRRDRALVAAFVLGSTYGVPHLIMGQVTVWLGFAIAVGLDALDRGDETLAGAAFGAAALVKIFPAVIGALLLRRRSWRAVAVAVATGGGALLVGVLAFGPELTRTYVVDVLLARFRDRTSAGTPPSGLNLTTVRRQLAALPGVDPRLFTPLALAVLGPPVVALYRRVDTDRRRMATVLGTLVATLLFLPLQPLYFALLSYPLVVLLYRLPDGWPRRTLVAGTLWSFALVGLDSVTLAVRTAPLPDAVASAALGAAEAVFAVVLPPTVGLWLLLIACVLVHAHDDPTASRSAD